MAPSFWYLLANHVRLSDIAAAMLCVFLSSAAVQWLACKGRRPMNWPVFGILPTAVVNIGNIYDWTTDAVHLSGGTFSYRGTWFSPYFGVTTVDPANIEYMLKTRFTNFPKGPYYRERFFDLLGDGIFNADDEIWREQRHAVKAEMHSSRFSDYSAYTIRELVHHKLLVVLGKVSAAGSAIDLQDVFLRFTFDNICTAAFGINPGCLATDLPEVPFAKAFEQAAELTLLRFIMPPFIWKPMKRLNIGSEKQLKLAVKAVHEFAERTVSDRRAELKNLRGRSQRSDLLTRIMEEGGESRFSDKFLKDFCISFILAGRDTSSLALAWFFWLLQEQPHVEERILDEINKILSLRGNGDAATPFAVEELKQMNYLQAALSESLRLYPPVPLELKEVVEDDMLPDGTRVQKGTMVMYSIYSMARMEGIWGKDCREFRPERWLRDGMLVNESQFKYAVFNGGPRLCVGKKFAYMQMKMVAASILLRYRVRVVVGHEVAPKLTATLYMKNGLLVTLEPRTGTQS